MAHSRAGRMTCAVRADTSETASGNIPHTSIFDPNAAVVQTDHPMRKFCFWGQERGEKKDPLCLESFERLNYFSFRQILRNRCKPVGLWGWGCVGVLTWGRISCRDSKEWRGCVLQCGQKSPKSFLSLQWETCQCQCHHLNVFFFWVRGFLFPDT